MNQHLVRSLGMRRERAVTAWLVCVVWLIALPASPHTAAARPFAYVTDLASGALTELSTIEKKVAATLPIYLGGTPRNVKMTADGTRAYVTGAESISAIDTATNTVVDTIQIPGCGEPACVVDGIDVTRDGALLYVVTIGRSVPGHDTVTVIETATHRVVASITAEIEPHDIALGPNGFAYVTLASRAVAVIDMRTQTLAATVPLAQPAVALAVTPDGRFVYVATEGGIGRTLVSVIDTRRNTTIADIPVALGALGIAVNPNGTTVYVASVSGTVSVIDTASNKVTATLTIDKPERVTFAPDGTFAYVSEVGAAEIAIVDTTQHRLIGNIRVGQAPLGVAFTSDARTAYVANANSADVHVIDTGTRTVTEVIRAGYSLLNVAVHPDGHTAYVTSWENVPGTDPNAGALLVIDTSRNAVTTRIPVVGSRLTVSPSGEFLYVMGDQLSVVDTRSNEVTTTIPLPDLGEPSGLAVSPNGSRVYAGGRNRHSCGEIPCAGPVVLVIDALTATVAGRIEHPEEGTATDIVLTPDGGLAYVTVKPIRTGKPSDPPPPVPSAEGLLVIDTATLQVIATIPVRAPLRIAMRPDGRFAYVATASDSVVVVDTTDHHIAASVAVGLLQRSIAVTPDGSFAYVVFGSSIAVINTATNQLAATIPIGGSPFDIAIGPDVGRFCPGDCSADGRVTIDELMTGVLIVLGEGSIESCLFLDADGSGQVTVDELVRAVHAALAGCGL